MAANTSQIPNFRANLSVYSLPIIDGANATLPLKKATSPAKKKKTTPSPAPTTRASTRQATPSAKSLEAAATTTGRTRSRSPAKKSIMPPKARASLAKKSPAKATKKIASPAKDTPPKRGRGRPRKESQQEYEPEPDDGEEVLPTTERSPTPNPSRNTRGQTKSPARKTSAADRASSLPRSLGKTPVLKSKAATPKGPRVRASSTPEKTSAKVSVKQRSWNAVEQSFEEEDFDEEALQVLGPDDEGEPMPPWQPKVHRGALVLPKDINWVDHANLTEGARATLNAHGRNVEHPRFPAHPSAVTPKRGTARPLTPAKPSQKKGPHPRLTEEASEEALPTQSKSTRKPSRTVPPSASGSKDLSPGKPSAKGRGKVISVTNPERIPMPWGEEGLTDRRNPFFETMPAPEIWHRRMAPVFPFGETKRQEEIMSDQINEDLMRSHKENIEEQKPAQGVWSRASSYVGSLISPGKARPTSQPSSPTKKLMPKRFDMWKLPELEGGEEEPVSPKKAGKRKAPTTSSLGSPGKKQRTGSVRS